MDPSIAVSGVKRLPDAETWANRSEGKGHNGDIFCAGKKHHAARGYPQTQEHLPQSRRGGLRGGSSAPQTNQKTSDAKNVDRVFLGIVLRIACRCC